MLGKSKNSLLVGALALSMIPGVSQAEDIDFAKIYVDCGLGGIVGSAFGKDEKTVSKVIAISTNITWDLGTTASTSYFSSQDTCMNDKAHIAAYINQSYEKIEQELASGEGNYLDALAKMAKSDSESVSEYNAQLRANYAKVIADDSFESMSRYQKVEKLFELVA